MYKAGLHDYNLDSASVESKEILRFKGLLTKISPLPEFYHFGQINLSEPQLPNLQNATTISILKGHREV